MNNKLKKTLAKEILIFISTCIICLVGYFIILFIVNYQNSVQKEKVKQNVLLLNKIGEIESKIEKINFDNDTLFKLYNHLKKTNFDVPESYISFHKTLSFNMNEREKYYKYLIENNYNKIPNSFQQFNLLYFNSKNELEISNLKNKISLLQNSILKIENYNNNTNLIFYRFSGLLFLFVYPFRFIILLLKWSIKTLKT